MPRIEFSRKTRAAVFLRAKGCCEKCGMKFKLGEGEYDHVLPAAFGGEATAENAQLICRACHSAKTKGDIGAIRKSDRVRDRNSGARLPSKHVIPGSKRSPWKRKINGEVVPR